MFNNWSHHSTTSTKVKKPYLEHLVFRGLQYRTVAILRSVGVFPKLKCVTFIPALKVFDEYYQKNEADSKNQITNMLGWIGVQLNNRVPTKLISEDKQKSKGNPKISREIKELLKTVLLQEGSTHKSLLLPFAASCIARWTQTYSLRLNTPVFGIGYLVNNSTFPKTDWQSNNPAEFNHTPRHMPCVQKEVGDDHEKEYIKKFTDLTFKQKIGDSRRNNTEYSNTLEYLTSRLDPCMWTCALRWNEIVCMGYIVHNYYK